MRLATTHAVQSSVQVVDAMYTLAGGGAVYESSPLQRQLRDVHVASQHIMVSSNTLETIGQLLLGTEAKHRDALRPGVLRPIVLHLRFTGDGPEAGGRDPRATRLLEGRGQLEELRLGPRLAEKLDVEREPHLAPDRGRVVALAARSTVHGSFAS